MGFAVAPRPAAVPPNTLHVRGTNYCDIGFVAEPEQKRLVVISAIDNLMKGAAGSAVQAMKLGAFDYLPKPFDPEELELVVQRAFELLTGRPTKLVAFSDDMDGLRKVPDNVPNQELLKANLHKPLTVIEKSALRAAKLTENLLAYAGKTEISLEPVDLQQLVEEQNIDLARSYFYTDSITDLPLLDRVKAMGFDTLEVTPDRVALRSLTPAGVFRGTQTFRQLLPPSIEARRRSPSSAAEERAERGSLRRIATGSRCARSWARSPPTPWRRSCPPSTQSATRRVERSGLLRVGR